MTLIRDVEKGGGGGGMEGRGILYTTDNNFWRKMRAEADSNRGPSAYQPNALPLGPTGS